MSSDERDEAQALWDLIARAQELDGAERDAFLEDATRGDPERLGRIRAALENGGVDDSSEDSSDPHASWADQADLVGRTIDEKYELVEEIGRGGMGRVFRARHRELAQDFALKLLPEGRGIDEVVREGRRLAEVDHRAIVQVVDVGAFEGIPYLVLEWIEGFDLMAWLQVSSAAAPSGSMALDDGLREFASARNADGRLALDAGESYWRFVATTMRDIARAVGRAHSLGVAHQDISPKNVLVTRDGSAVLIDFGLAATLPAHGGASDPNPRGGTAPYMAPEHRRRLDDASLVANDVYGLGATLLHLATGVRPDRLRLSRRVLRSSLRFDGRTDRGSIVPRELLLIGWKATHEDPAERFASADAFADELDRFLGFKPLSFESPHLAHLARLWWRRSPTGASLTLMTPVFLAVAFSLGERIVGDVRAAARKEALRVYATLPPFAGIDANANFPGDLGNVSPDLAEKTLARMDEVLDSIDGLDSLRWRRALHLSRMGRLDRAEDDLEELAARHPGSTLLRQLAPVVGSEDEETRHRLIPLQQLHEPAVPFDHAILATLHHLFRGGPGASPHELVKHAASALARQNGRDVDIATLELMAVAGTIELNTEAYASDLEQLVDLLGDQRSAGMLHAEAFARYRDTGEADREIWEDSLELCPDQYHANQALIAVEGEALCLQPDDAGDALRECLDSAMDLHAERLYSSETVALIARLQRTIAVVHSDPIGLEEDAREFLDEVERKWKEAGADTHAIRDLMAAHDANVLREAIHRAEDGRLPYAVLDAPPALDPGDAGPAIRSGLVLAAYLRGDLERDETLNELSLIHERAVWAGSTEAPFTAEALAWAIRVDRTTLEIIGSAQIDVGDRIKLIPLYLQAYPDAEIWRRSGRLFTGVDGLPDTLLESK